MSDPLHHTSTNNSFDNNNNNNGRRYYDPRISGLSSGFSDDGIDDPQDTTTEGAVVMRRRRVSTEEEMIQQQHQRRAASNAQQQPPTTSTAGDNQYNLTSQNQSPGLRFLNVVRTVQQIQRREKMLKMQSNRTLVSNASSGGAGEQSILLRHLIPPDERTSLRSNNNPSNNIELEHDDGGRRIGYNTYQAEKVPTSVILGSTVETGMGDGEDNNNIDDPKSSFVLEPITTWQAILAIIFGKGLLSYLLLAAPFALMAKYLHWGDTWVFWLNFLVMIPLASILSDFTEEAALHTNETIGGLLNASFGNAVEVVIAVQALLANEIRVVQASMLGSILSNLLLVLGCCFFFGGLYHKELTFNTTGATANMGLLALSSIALILPTPYAEYYNLHDEHVLKVSRISAISLIFMYAQLLLFQLKTHAHLFDDIDNDTHAVSSVAASTLDHEAPSMSLFAALCGLSGTTLLVALFSDYLVDSIDGFVDSSGISRTFVGLILLPIVGNAVEHVSAVTVAIKDKMDLAMGVAIGSCTQISLFVVPLTVLVGWMLDKPMTLNFPQFEVVMYIMSVLTVSIVLSNPRCNWLEGSLLITTYLLIAVGFWFEEVKNF